MRLQSKDLLGLRETPPEDIALILETAASMKRVLRSPSKKTTHLQGKSVVTLFYENSTRTRLSFEMASKFMGAASANIAATGSSVSKGESLIDTARTIDNMATDILVMRHSQSGAPHLIAPLVDASVVNAGDGMNEHPTQALLDMFTIQEKLGDLRGLEIAIVGDLAHSRVLRSNTYGLLKMGASVRVAGPATLIPPGLAQPGVQICANVREACRGADAVMALRLQLERQKSALFPSVSEYAAFFALDAAALSEAKPGALVMHPGPCNHGVEMPTAIYDSDRSVINEQVTNGVAVRMAVMYLLIARRNEA
ncbi:MAG: aspartate carbamoyltransferase catalytic subunit [Clostridia bacterium]|nr:aspartate carbamoyltransferase catalytic subunit [Clostridia bacterium]